MNWFLYDNGLRHERVKIKNKDTGTMFTEVVLMSFLLFPFLQKAPSRMTDWVLNTTL